MSRFWSVIAVIVFIVLLALAVSAHADVTINAKIVFKDSTCKPENKPCLGGRFVPPNTIIIYDYESYRSAGLDLWLDNVFCHEMRHLYEYRLFGNKSKKGHFYTGGIV